MIAVASRDTSRAFDRFVIEHCRVPSVVLMENAGRGAADVVMKELSLADSPAVHHPWRGRVVPTVVVVCGTGNNGADGLVVARHLVARGMGVRVVLVGEASRRTEQCQMQSDAFVGIGGQVDAYDPALLGAALRQADLIVDALFGTGLDRPLSELHVEVVRAINASGRKIVALDLPSGTNADTGMAMPIAVDAAITVTFGQPKLGHFAGQGGQACRAPVIVDLGVPPGVTEVRVASLVEFDDVSDLLTPRALDAHKYRCGHVLVVGGAPGTSGAALLAAKAALRAGAGAATLATWPNVADWVEGRQPEIMVARLHADGVASLLERKGAVVLGPGLGVEEPAKRLVERVLALCAKTVVVDADGLSGFAGRPEALAEREDPTILTPHAGELGRLLGISAAEVEADRFGVVQQASVKTQSVVLLKGRYTVVASPDGRMVINSTGNAALATAGSGDVLAGICGALACILPAFEAAYCAAWIHGATGDAWMRIHGDRGLLAHEIAEGVPGVLRQLVAKGVGATSSGEAISGLRRGSPA